MEIEGEGTQVGVLNLSICECLVVVQGIPPESGKEVLAAQKQSLLEQVR